MQFPLSFEDVGLWLAGMAIILLATTELISPRYGKRKVLVEMERLRQTALILGILFLATVVIRVYQIIVLP